MTTFDHYSAYYDLLYRDKNYDAEASFVKNLLEAYAPTARSILELGCGTGLHAQRLATGGYDVHGIDLSASMLDIARTRQSEGDAVAAGRTSFALGDVRTYSAGRRFDAVVSLFHVMSYQTSNEDLIAALKTVAAHLEDGGTFIFDFWFGPAVLTQKPEVRVKRIESDTISVVRIAEPELHYARSVCDVNYTVFVSEKQTGSVQVVTEKHAMRYLFLPELQLLADQVGLTLLDSFEWMTKHEPDKNTWSVCVVMRK